VEQTQLDSVLRIAEAIENYGALVLGFAVFLVIGMMAVVFIIRNYQKSTKGEGDKYKTLFAEFQAQNQVVFQNMQNQNQKVFENLLQHAFKGNPPEIVPESITTTGLVREQLKHSAALTKADRVSVYAFHNGQRMTTGRHMIKVSCWAEYVMLTRLSRIGKNKDIHVAKIQDMCATLLSESRWEALTEDDVKKTQFDTWDDGEDNIKSAFAHSIHSTDGIIIGFVLMEYLLSPIEPAWVEKARKECKTLSNKVSIVLDVDFSDPKEHQQHL